MNIKSTVKQIDTEFGVGYAKEHPDLIGALFLTDALHEIDKTFVEAVEAVERLISTKFRLF